MLLRFYAFKSFVLLLFPCFLFSGNFKEEIIDGIQVFSEKPSGEGPFPVLFILHGDQKDPSLGAKQMVDFGYLDLFQQEGIFPVAISMPGYGGSKGENDLAGEVSQKAIAHIIDYIAHLPFVNPRKMGVYGISKGAILASLLHKWYPHLNLQILEAGIYDIGSTYPKMPPYFPKFLSHVQAIQKKEGQAGLKNRSAIYYTDSMPNKTLILHGEIDDRQGLPSAIKLHEALLHQNKMSILKVLPKEPHMLSNDKKRDIIIPFLKETFLEIYGIGIKIARCFPALQIYEILPGSSAEKSGKLLVGDVILKIAPFNDDCVIELLNEPLEKFRSLTWGPKNTFLRLYIQHLDLSEEEVVLQRGPIIYKY